MCPEVKILIQIHKVHVLAHTDSRADVLWVSVPEERLLLGIRPDIHTFVCLYQSIFHHIYNVQSIYINLMLIENHYNDPFQNVNVQKF